MTAVAFWRHAFSMQPVAVTVPHVIVAESVAKKSSLKAKMELLRQPDVRVSFETNFRRIQVHVTAQQIAPDPQRPQASNRDSKPCYFARSIVKT